LDKVDEIPTGFLEKYGGDWPHFHRLAAELDSTDYEAMEFGSHVLFESGPRRAGLRQSEEEGRIARGMGRSDRRGLADEDAADY